MDSTDDRVLLHLSVIEENYDVVKFLLKRGVHINARACNKDLTVEFKTDPEHRLHATNLGDDQQDIVTVKSCTALHLAARHQDNALAEVLVQSGAEIDARMEGGETPLIIAVVEGRADVVKLLLEHGANANLRTHWGKTSLHYAAQVGNKHLVELLLKHEANPDAVSKDGLTPLHLAVEAGYKDVVGILVKSGANLDLKTEKGASAIHFAAIMGHADVLEMLVQGGADISCIWKRGCLDLSPFDWVSPDKEMKIRELVSKYTSKSSLVNWYNSVMTKFYKKTTLNKERRNLVNTTI